MKKELIVKKSVELSRTSSEVWDALTKTHWTKQYMYNSEIISDWRAGDGIVWRNADDRKVYVRGIIVKIDPGKLLITSDFNPNLNLPDIKENYSTVTYQLLEKEGKTLLNITEENFNGDEFRYNDSNQFWETVLKNLHQLMEKP